MSCYNYAVGDKLPGQLSAPGKEKPQQRIKMQEKLISIVVPVFNTEKYVERCLKSLVSQTYSNLEIIVVNDCSSENIEEILQQLMR